MTPFTDDDLKRLKEHLFEVHDDLDDDCREIAPREVNALLARLETAETLIKAWEEFSLEIHSRVRNTKKEFVLRMKKANATEAWRKSCGKE